MDALTRARELAEEHHLHVVCLALRGTVPDGLAGPLLAEAEADVAALLEAEERPVWWAERDEMAVLLVVDALAQDLKESLVRLEDEHWLGPWLNVDLVTELADGRVDVWHGSPMRPAARPLPDGLPEEDLAARLPEGFGA